MSDFENRVYRCPCCWVLLEDMTNIGNLSAPRPRDVTLCIQCGELLEFVDDSKLIPVTEETRQGAKESGPEEYQKLMELRQFVLDGRLKEVKDGGGNQSVVKTIQKIIDGEGLEI